MKRPRLMIVAFLAGNIAMSSCAAAPTAVPSRGETVVPQAVAPSLDAANTLSPDFELARNAWLQGARADAAGAGWFVGQAVQYLRAGLATDAQAAHPDGRAAYLRAIGDLRSIEAVPETDATPEQVAEAKRLIISVNAFFGSDGAWGYSSPSATPPVFVATLQLEARLGTLDAGSGSDDAFGSLPPLPAGVVTCPDAPAMAKGAAFACHVISPQATVTCPSASPTSGTPVCTVASGASSRLLLVGELEDADGTVYKAVFAPLSTPFVCGELDAVEVAALRHIGGRCA